MFNSIPDKVLAQMSRLEAQDVRDREDGTPRMQRLRQIPPDTGRFLALLAASAPPGHMVEIGTSAGYSALWLALACRATGRRLVTYEVLPEKARLAEETFRLAGVTDVVDLVLADARERLPQTSDISFCFLDAEKEVYKDCYDIVVPRMVRGGLLVADNAINHRESLLPMLEEALSDQRLDSLVVPIGKGELVCRRL